MPIKLYQLKPQGYKCYILHVDLPSYMQTTKDIFVNPSVIKTTFAGQLVDDTKQVPGKSKLLVVKCEYVCLS